MAAQAPEPSSPEAIREYHAHIYYDGATRRAAAELRAQLGERFKVALGRWRDEPVGPHPGAMYQVAFAPEIFAELLPWLMLNRRGLTILVHPNTGRAVPDHADFPLWLGEKLELDIDKLG
ncbi:MAG: DOPA 4,5-dioxygenase family protein [Alphaproteobacteria bacterium]|mgnify:CR=1 FL=1|jgi:DOPA 4,5-dioxygenase|nr:DOPA 4,5-dioxygenase family protein [Alphaproteobacteria bacterium]MDP6589645.1 DOPA 4,5-dioxygenase family protein [Alphaproteobacteria bacterium]MDP6817522.1 DOPA 4,5-dioxygenase family protein [Alphaproteobacteria bacterium]